VAFEPVHTHRAEEGVLVELLCAVEVVEIEDTPIEPIHILQAECALNIYTVPLSTVTRTPNHSLYNILSYNPSHPSSSTFSKPASPSPPTQPTRLSNTRPPTA
jgi:hypothetical protein